MKRPTGLIILSSLGILLGFFLLYLFRVRYLNSIRYQHGGGGNDAVFFGIALIYIALNILMLFLYDWVRKIILVISWLYICWTMLGFMRAFPCSGQGCVGLFILIFSLPILLYFIVAVIYLTKPKIKELFIQRDIV
jgi:hypothetical protein